MANGLLLGRFFLITWIFRLLMYLDDLLLTLCRASYKVFVYTSRITLINGEQIELFTNRVYLILGIALVFIIAYNLLTYIVDPDKISDKKSGAGAFVKNVIISLTIIVITPMAFVKLYSFQNTVITQGIIANIIMGVPSNDSEEDSDLANLTDSERAEELLDRGAKNVTTTVYASFIVPAGNGFSALDCAPVSKYDPIMTQKGRKPYCDAYKYMQETGSNSEFRTLIDDYEDEFDYYFIVSTAGVLVMLFFFASYCIELGKRAGKLAILQLLAPIPVAMEIVPGKSGSRQKWLNEVISTYLDVFIYQATVFIVIFLSRFVGPTIQNLFSTAYSGSTGVISVVERTFALVFLTFGLFKFGKDVPKMIEDLIGIKGAGSFGDVAKRAFAMAGVSGGLLGATATRFSRNMRDENGKWKLRNIGSGLAGVGSGVVRTLWGARNAHSIKDARNLRRQVNNQLTAAKVNRANYTARGGGNWLKGHNIRVQERRDDRRTTRHERWAGTGYTAQDAQLQSHKKFMDAFKDNKIDTNADKEYTDYRKKYNDSLANIGISPDEFNAKYKEWKKTANANANTLNDYLNDSQAMARDWYNNPNAANLYDPNTGQLRSDIRDAWDFMNNREKAMILDKKDNLLNAIAKYKALGDNDAELSRIYQKYGINFNDLNTRLSNAASIGNDDEFVTVYNEIKSFQKALKKEDDVTMRKIESERIARQEREARQKNNSNNH